MSCGAEKMTRAPHWRALKGQNQLVCRRPNKMGSTERMSFSRNSTGAGRVCVARFVPSRQVWSVAPSAGHSPIESVNLPMFR